jgi:hypothetical protein
LYRRYGILLGIALLLAGCSANGDFGRVKPSLVRDDIHDWVGLDAIAGRQTMLSKFELTDDERQLRDLAYPLIEPAYDRQQWYSILGEYGVIGASHRAVFDRTAYATRLLSSRYSSANARYAQLIDDINNDTTRIEPFFENGWRVLDTDKKRQRALAFVGTSDPERIHVRRRVQENALIVAWVRTSLNRRASSYRFALERLVIMTPSPMAVDAERALNAMQARAGQYQRGAPARGMRTASSL